MRRRKGSLLAIERSILAVASELKWEEEPDFYGFAVAKRLAGRNGGQRLVAHGTLYKALGRLESGGLLRSEWEEADLASQENRPRRRLYRITPLGERALVQSVTNEVLRPGAEQLLAPQ